MKFLGLDIGTGGSRAVAIDETGRTIAAGWSDHENFASPHPGWAEQDPDDWWRASCEAIRACLASGPVRANEIGGVSFSGQMHGAVLLDESDRPLRPALIWCDQRTGEQCREITERIGKADLISAVSNPAITGFTLPKLLWIKRHEPETWSRVKSILLPKDYVRLRLTGDKASEVSDLSGTLMFDVARRTWSDLILDAFEVDRVWLPTVHESIEQTGVVGKAGSEATGLAAGTLVFAGASDNAAGAVGMGIVRPGAVSVTIGTSGVVFAVSDEPRLDPAGRIHTLCHAVPGRWHNTGVTQAAGLSLRWLRDNMFGGKVTYDQMTTDAEKVPPGSDGLIWLPYLMGERSPHMDPDARAAFVGLTASHRRAHLTRAVMEGVAFSLRDSLEIFKENGVNIDSIRLGGGGARSALWQQIQADVYGKPVELIEVDEGAAFGAALLAGTGAGAWNSVDRACSETIRVRTTVDPDRAGIDAMQHNYETFRELYRAIKPRQLETKMNPYEPLPEHKFTFGLWTVGNVGRDPFGEAVRDALPPTELVKLLGEVGAYGVNFHDNDLVPIDATPAERDAIVNEFRVACEASNLRVPMATVNLFYDRVFRDGAFTSNDPEVRQYSLQKTMRAMDLGAEFGAEIFVLWGGREGVETDACRRPDEAIKRMREAINVLCEYSVSQGYGYKFALEAKPNEPRADIYFPTTTAFLAFIPTLDRPEMVGVNPEVAHETMPGLNMMHAVAQAWESGKLFHIDLNDQVPGRYDQDLRFGSANPKGAFWLVKFLEDVGYAGMRHFDAHAYRTEDYEGVKDFARGCMKTYLIFKEKAAIWNEHPEIRAILDRVDARNVNRNGLDTQSLLSKNFDRAALSASGLQYERLDQLTMDVLFGVI